MITLALDASTYTGTVAVVRDGKLLAAAEAAMRGEREEHLMPAVVEAVEAAGVGLGDLDRLVCGAGPGSFTSLRIAASIAKGIAFGRDLPLHAVSSLALMVAALEPLPEPGRYLALLDALRSEAYAQPVDVIEGAEERGAVRPVGEPMLVSREAVATLAASLGAVTVGREEEISAAPHARGLIRLEGIVRESGPVDLAAWEPDYGRLAEAQVRWEAAHGRPLPQDGG